MIPPSFAPLMCHNAHDTAYIFPPFAFQGMPVYILFCSVVNKTHTVKENFDSLEFIYSSMTDVFRIHLQFNVYLKVLSRVLSCSLSAHIRKCDINNNYMPYRVIIRWRKIDCIVQRKTLHIHRK